MTKERPTFSECVIGYRSWRLADWVLAPVSYGHPWRPGVNRAKCVAHEGLFPSVTFGSGITFEPPKPKNHAAPQQDCTCGLHAYHEIPQQAEGVVIGAVAAWGDLQVHCNGFRAEYAQILALVAADGLEEVAGLYGVPLVPLEMLTMEAHQHGSPLPESMRPEKPKPPAQFEAIYQRMLGQLGSQISGQIYSAPSSVHWGYSAPSYPAINTSPLWQITPTTFAWTDEIEEEKPKKLGKRPANRQGPPKPKRAPKRLGGR